jgi:uncharacterized protein (DUF433 family)
MNLPDFLVQDTDGFIHLAGHRIGLQDVAYYYNEGCSAEDLCEIFPTLPLVLIHKLLVFYLENAAEVDGYIAKCETEMERQRASAGRGPDVAELRRRLSAKQATGCNHGSAVRAGRKPARSALARDRSAQSTRRKSRGRGSRRRGG